MNTANPISSKEAFPELPTNGQGYVESIIATQVAPRDSRCRTPATRRYLNFSSTSAGALKLMSSAFLTNDGAIGFRENSMKHQKVGAQLKQRKNCRGNCEKFATHWTYAGNQRPPGKKSLLQRPTLRSSWCSIAPTMTSARDQPSNLFVC